MKKKYSADRIIAMAINAGQKAMQVRKEGLTITIKPDGSKVTNADYASDDIIAAGLREIDPDVYIVSEEDKNKPKNGEYNNAWVIDPIDGISSFIKKLPDWSVLIAKVDDKGAPVEGVAYFPERNVVYYTDGDCAYKQSVVVSNEGVVAEMGPRHELKTHKSTVKKLHYNQFISDISTRFPKGSEDTKYTQPSNSMAVIEGAIDIAVNPHTMGDWDLAAPDAILRKAGGGFVSADTGELLKYGLKRTEDRAYLQDESIAGNIETLVCAELANKTVKQASRQGIH